MKPILPLVLLAAALAASAPAFADGDPAAEKKAEWFADFDKAVEAAKAQKKDLLVDFTGSDWCIWCKRLHEQVFSKPEFESEAPKGFVLVALDFDSMGKSRGPNAQRSDALKEKSEIEGFPTVLVMTPDGEVLARGSYNGAQNGPKAWLDAISASAASGREAIAAGVELEKQYAAADKDDARAEVVAQAASRLEDAAKAGAPSRKLASIVRHGLTLDPENKTGLGAPSLKSLLAAGEADAAEASLAKKFDPKNEVGLLELELGARFKTVARSGEGIAEFVADAKALAATGELKDPAVYVMPLANACAMAKQKLDDAAAAREIAKVLRAKRPEDARLMKFLSQFGDDDAAPDGKK